MDANKVWQWRIMHVKKYSRRPDPFYFSNRIGLDFNVASSVQKKLDLQLVTNGVILEVCNFAKIVNKSKRRFLTNILENNFDLGFENEQQRIDFSARIHYKVKELIRKTPKDKNEVFTLFDTSSKAERNSNYGLTTASSEHLVEMDETDHSEHEDEFKFSQVISKEYLQTEGLSEEMDEAPGDDSEHDYEFKYSKAQSAEELQEDCLPPLFPYCEGIGLNLDVGSKQSLDPDLLTNGVMLELVHFTRILTASYSPIVLDVLEHNFELDLKSQQEKSRLWFKISHLLRRRNRLLATGTKISLNFKDEQFSFQTHPLKRTKFSTLSNVEASQYHLKDVMKRRQSDLKSNQKKRALSRSSERANKRHRIEQFEDMETNSLSHHTDLCTSEKAEEDHGHTFPLGECDQDSDKVTNPGYTSKLDHLQSPKSCSLNFDIAGDTEPSYLGFCTPLFTTTEISSSSSTVNSNVNPPFASQPEERGLCGGEEPSQTPRNGSNKHDMEQDEMGTEIMWKLRANRVKQILSSPKTEKDYCQFTMSKKAGLEFNVGFGPKKNISVDSLSNCVLLEVAKFALAMNSSQQDFIMEILEYNFDFGLQSQHQRNLFTCEIMKRVRKLRICEDAVRFSKEVFQLPGPMSSKMNMANQSVVGVTPELSSELRIKECAVVVIRLPHSHAETRQHISQKIVDLYPFCKKIGLKLHVNKSQPNKKLDINKLTNGAMTEVMNFAEKLCGTFEQICLDILRHNLDLDSQSGHSDLARDILARIPVIMEQKNVSNCASLDRKIKGTGTDYSTMVQLDCQNSANLDASSAGPSKTATRHQYEDTSADIQQQDEHNLMLWKLRASYIEYILSVPHEEHCPFYSYSRCKKIGIDFNVGSGIKQNLDPKLLTNGIMVELTKFATALLSSQRYFITDILEYNFHLDFKNELHRSAFATQTWYAIQAVRKKFSFSRINMLFELPDLRYIQESTKCCPRCYQVRTDKLHQDESDAGHMHHPRPHTMTDTFVADANSTAQKPAKELSSTLSAAVETVIDRYSRCKKIGLDLCVDKDQPKDKVDLHLLTHGIINEMFNFTMKLCGTKNKIINDVIEHNFKIGMQRQDINPAAMFLAVLKKYKKCGSQAWLSEVYVIQHYPQKQFRHASKGKQATSMRKSELKETFKKRKLALQTKGKVTAPERMETENYYTCPLGESDLDWGDITDSGGEEQTQTLRNEPTECDMEQEEMGTETLWKLRANRVKQILSSPNRALGEYSWSKKAGLEFNVGFGPKQHISVDSLTNSVLLEVAKFALAMNSSQQDFIMEILEYNFDFGLQSQHQRNLFICEIMRRVRNSRSCEDAVRFSKEYLQLPGPMSSVNMANQSMGSVNPELSSELRVEDCDVASVCPPNLNAKTKEHISQKIVDLYPFCKKIGLKLHVNKIQPNKKLDINNLTSGAMTEVMNFAEKLCGTFEQICLDILRHNLDLDSQSGHSDLARDILAQIPAIMEQKSLSNCASLDRKIKGTGTDYSTMVQLDCQNSANLDASSAGPSEAATIDQYVDTSADIQQQDEHNLMLWKLRASYIEYILSVPHEEHCPFYSYSRCKKIGIDFNVGSGIKQNLDPKLLTNGIMDELTKFATALLSSQRYFITDILEYNFHLDFKNELHRSAFATQTWYAIQAVRKKFSFSRINMLFELPDLRYIQESTKCCPRCYQVRTDKLHQDESDAGHMHHPRPHTMTDTFVADANSTAQKPAKELSSTLSAAVETVIDRYSRCKKIGLDLCVDKDQPKDKVDLHLLTHGIINEVFNFTMKLCGTKNKIINDVLEHNFKIGMQRQDINPAAMFLAVLKKYKKCGSQAWLSEVYVIQHYPQKQFRHASKGKPATSMRKSELKETFKKRKLALQTKGKVTAPERMETENYYTCPLGESDLDWGDITDSGGEEQTQTLRNEPTECDMEQEEMGTETLWKLRANRVKQILSSPNRALGEYSWSKKAGLEFNVGFGPKQHISVDSLTNSVLLEVAKFALAMNSSQQDFIMEILEYNFDFGLQSQHQRDLFICEIIRRVRNSRSCEDAVRFSKEYLQLPGPMSSVNMANQSMGSVNPELSSELRIEDCDVASVCPPNLNAKTKEHISQKIVDLYPFCKKIGLKLHVNKIQPNKKLDINNLTSGAMTEVMNFAEKLCGTFEQICLDILRHNLDLDSQSGHSDLARDILAQIPAIMEQKNLSNCASLDRKIKGTGTDYSTMVQLDCQNSANLDASSAGPSEAATIDQYVDTSADIQQQDEHNLMLWKLRASYIEYILSVPHEEHCPFYSYSRCKKIGIDFNVGSGIKQNLDPKLLTNGIMVELTKFATALLSSQRYFITDILEYNFHLDFKNELHRSAFATQTWYAIQAARKKFNFSRINMLFELPDLRYIQESTKCCPRCYQVRTDKLHQDESDAGHMHHPRPHTMTDTFVADANSTAQKPAKDLSSTLSAAVETVIDRYSRCKKIGLDLCVDKDQPKDKVDLHLLTHGIINEMFNFTMKLCGTKNKIINDVIEHNFKIGMQRQDINPAAMFLAVLKKYKKCGSQAWLSEVYVIQHYPQKQFRHASKGKPATSMRKSELKETFKKRKLALQTKGKVTAPERMETENYYTCPLGESDLDWGDITDSGGEEQTQTLRNEPTECDMEQEEMGTETLWKLRANRVKQILSSPNRALGEYSWSKKAGLEFNVGFGPKQHISVDSLTNSVLLEVAKFALAMNSSQQDFIMEILEYNFDFGLQSQHQRDLFICEIMKRVRISRSCEDAVRFSKEYLQLPGPMSSVNTTNQSMGSVNPELSSELRVEDCDVASVCPPNLNAKTKEHISQKIVDLYPFCKKIGLKLHVNKIQPNKKLDINNLTNGAMTEVMNFAEKLCGTFEQICLDILRHNLDLDSQSGHSDLARDILARIPAIMEQKNVSNCASLDRKIKGTGTDYSTMVQLDCQNSANLDASSAGPSKTATRHQYEDTSADIQQQDEHNLMLWKLRASYIEYILSVPHEEHCPFYSYSRCKKIGIDFNVGSGIKQNLDPKLLTNGIMVELTKFATALLSSQRYFITDILEYNFHLDFKNELHRSAFATQTWYAVQAARKKFNFSRINMLFELPDLRYIQESTKCCPRCYQVRTDKLHQDESDAGHMHHPRPHTMTDTFLADANSTAQKPAKDLSSTLSAAVETVIDRYSRCKKIGLDLCVDKDQPKDKVDLHLLTHGIINEMFNFTMKLCGTKNKIINDVIEHNFKIGMQRQDINPAAMFLAVLKKYKKSGSQAWLSEIYVIQHYPQKQFRHASKGKPATSMRKSELKETFKKRKLALQTKGKVTAPERMETENYYTCPLGESDLDLNITDSGGEEQTQTLVPNECDMEQEEMGTETLWKLRANRVKQILSSPNKEFGKFTLSKRAGMKFCVGFGPKQHICVDSLTNSVLLEVAKFALAMNSSQQDFIMEILEYNFDFGLQSQHQRDLFTCEIMKRVRKLRSCEDAIKFSKEVFELPGPMLSINMANQSMVSVNSQLIIESRMEECDVAPVCPSDSHTESNEHISEMIMDPYPFCKEIGLKLHINNRKQNTKLDINKLTNGAMSEVTNFAEQLCGTFEQICLDILRHNFDFDLQSGDARSIVAAVCEQKNLSSKLSKHLKIKGTKATNLNQDCQNDQTLDASGTGSSQAAVMDDKTEYPEELDLKLWKLRANQMQQILSIPHGEHCPLYSYRRCKTLGIDFSVGSGVKQNLDPKLLTNGIMVEVDTFANALHSAEKYFITEILEYNFHLDFKSELHRSAFTLQIWTKVRGLRKHKSSIPRMNMPFELPDIQEPISDRPKYCPKCYQDRNDKLHQDESHPSEMHHPRPPIMLDTVSADANCIEQKPAKDPSLTFSATEEMIMDRYPRCKKIGLNLCVNKDQPKDKLDMHVLTSGIIVEVASFAKKLCGSKLKTICAIIENNFNMSLQPVDIWNKVWLSKEIHKDGGHAWLDEVCVFQPQRQPRHLKLVEASATQISERRETIEKRMLALQIKEKRPTLPSPNTSVVKSKTHQRSKGKCFPHCTEIGLDLDVTSKSGQKEKLDLNLLTRAVVCEIHKFAVKNPGNYMPHTLFDILDYNFDLSSQHYRRREFSIATTSKVQAMVKQRDMNRNRPHEVFKLPFIFAPRTHNEKPKKHSRKEPVKKKRMGRNHSDSSDDDFLNVVENNEVAWSFEDTEFSIDPWSALPMCESPVSEGCDSPLQGNIQIGEKEYDAHFGNMNPELDSETAVSMSRSLESEACGSPVQGNIQTKEEKYYPQYGNMKPELDTGTIVQMSGSLVSVGCGSPVQGNIQTKEEKYDPQYGNMKPELDTGTIVQMSGSLVSVGCGSPLQGNIQTKEEKYDPHHGNMKPEPDTEEKHHDDVKTKSNTEDAQHLVPGVATGLLGYMPVVVLPNFVGPQAGLQNQYVQCYILAEPQGPAIRPDIVSNLTPRLNTEGVQYLVPVQAVGCPMVTIGPGNESTLITQGQENVPADLQQGEVHRK
ncbi:hypothetical protein ABVT39_014571 [Epinephelus coioides]